MIRQAYPFDGLRAGSEYTKGLTMSRATVPLNLTTFRNHLPGLTASGFSLY